MKATLHLITVVAAIALSSSMADAQARRINSEVSCPSCSIVIENVVVLEGAFFNGPATTITRDSTGVFYLPDGSDGSLKVFGSDGRFVRQIGRRGAGPGEYEMVRNVLIARDGSIHVLDGLLGRHSVFSPHGEFLRSTPFRVRLGTGLHAVLLPDDQLVVNAYRRRPADAAYVLQRIDQNGKTTLLFEEAPLDWQKQWLQQRLLWRRRNGELLVAQPHSFTIDVYASDFTQKLSIARFADWIPAREPTEEPSDGVLDKPYTPRLRAIWEDAQGLLWLDMVVPSRSWKPGPHVKPGTPMNKETYSSLANRPRVETIIEVVDLDRQRVLARSRIEGSIGTPFGGGYIARSVEESAGQTSLRISRVSLKR